MRCRELFGIGVQHFRTSSTWLLGLTVAACSEAVHHRNSMRTDTTPLPPPGWPHRPPRCQECCTPHHRHPTPHGAGSLRLGLLLPWGTSCPCRHQPGLAQPHQLGPPPLAAGDLLLKPGQAAVCCQQQLQQPPQGQPGLEQGLQLQAPHLQLLMAVPLAPLLRAPWAQLSDLPLLAAAAVLGASAHWEHLPEVWAAQQASLESLRHLQCRD